MPEAMIDPWGSALVEDYAKLIRAFGMEPFDAKTASRFPDPNRLMRRGTVFAGQDLKQIADAIAQKKPYYVLSGIMPSAPEIHFGTKMTIENILYFQDHGAKTFVCIADLESAATRGITLEEAKHRALDFHVPAYLALGLDPKKTTFYFQSENRAVQQQAYLFSNKLTLNEYRAAYGSADPNRIVSSLIQSADILYPQFEEPMPGIIPVGADQAPHIRLSRDIVRRYKQKRFFLPSALYHKFVPSLDGEMKMSKSRPNSCVSIPENPEEAGKKMMRALTGGRATVEEQKRLGGIPEKCMVFELYKMHLVEDDAKLNDIYKRCKAGTLLCKEDKCDARDAMAGFMRDFDKKFKAAKKQVQKLKFATM